MYFVEIIKYGDGDKEEVIKRMGPIATKRQADKVDSGANINLNHEDYYTRIVEEK